MLEEGSPPTIFTLFASAPPITFLRTFHFPTLRSVLGRVLV